LKTKQSVTTHKITRFEATGPAETSDVLVVEEPLEIRIAHGSFPHRRQVAISVTMRTPGHDPELAAGFLFTEGIIRRPEDISHIRHIPATNRLSDGNVILVELAEGIIVDLKKLERHFYTTSSCGVCGKTSIDAVHAVCPPSRSGGFTIQPELLMTLPAVLRQEQLLFNTTGGLHAAGLFDREGRLLLLREDIGRHNAVDKIIGHQLTGGNIPLSEALLLVSGRGGFELVQKAAVAGIGFFASVGAPSSLAVELAASTGMTLVGFLKEKSFNLYSGSF
jgi:FdhD protein